MRLLARLHFLQPLPWMVLIGGTRMQHISSAWPIFSAAIRGLATTTGAVLLGFSAKLATEHV